MKNVLSFVVLLIVLVSLIACKKTHEEENNMYEHDLVNCDNKEEVLDMLENIEYGMEIDEVFEILGETNDFLPNISTNTYVYTISEELQVIVYASDVVLNVEILENGIKTEIDLS